jgi:hypothetical protein
LLTNTWASNAGLANPLAMGRSGAGGFVGCGGVTGLDAGNIGVEIFQAQG